ncbi:2-keto-4-pentenoate hydratase [Fictibacillus phosphorivorans]|uniref:2-keto-4-pentenoate hydratase n=1 Tax=Fictibacillus phosphorivorans TaxID=1221500 RepID=UPI0020402382|nr:fumarylacetoacetate hydrolase family protein [Fictibacillus phosphorivorans]MCM3720006.1 fumarylacetoacetate hydrolase family protein [Fictibacillus phosphorivorans]MCM3777724.1 fumarylacetoacetate hydrolase family protein [Fictibacillus phosphorivorans]
MQQQIISTLTAELLEAEEKLVPVTPLSKRYPELSVKDSYSIQLQWVRKKLDEGRVVIGKKVGLTSKAMQNMLGVNEPDYGHLLDHMRVTNGSVLSRRDFIKPKVEAEIGFILKEDLCGPNVTYIDVLMATEALVPALEIIDSRIEDWKIQLVDTVADNGSSARAVIGESFYEIDQVDLRTLSMTLLKNGEVTATGAGAAALGHPAQAVAWLANKLADYNISLKAGELILPGALSAAIDVDSGDEITAAFGKLGTVSISFCD